LPHCQSQLEVVLGCCCCQGRQTAALLCVHCCGCALPQLLLLGHTPPEPLPCLLRWRSSAAALAAAAARPGGGTSAAALHVTQQQPGAGTRQVQWGSARTQVTHKLRCNAEK
jgi:hypothetical protein